MGTIRRATSTDARALAAVHVRAWQRAYRGGLMPDTYLDGLSVDERARMWADALARPAPDGVVRLVAEDDAGDLVGFIVVGPSRGEVGPDDRSRGEGDEVGEVHALNVDPAAWGAGHGRALLDAGVAVLADAGSADAGSADAVLWVHADNARARTFYASAGWRPDGATRRQEVLGVEVPEVRYRRPLPGPGGG